MRSLIALVLLTGCFNIEEANQCVDECQLEEVYCAEEAREFCKLCLDFECYLDCWWLARQCQKQEINCVQECLDTI